MKRLHPLALKVVSADEVRLRCKPRFDQISGEDAVQDLMVSFKSRASDNATNASEIEAEFPFTFNEDRGVLPDTQFEYLTGDDYGDMWMTQSVAHLSIANSRGISIPDADGKKLYPDSILVDAENDAKTRRYKILFSTDDGGEQQDIFTVVGSGDTRTVSWVHGTHDARWSERNWTFDAPNPSENLQSLLLSILRMDEAINLELMPYAMNR